MSLPRHVDILLNIYLFILYIIIKIYIIKLHYLNKMKIGLPCLEWTWILNGMKMLWYSVFPFLFFMFRTNYKKVNSDESDFRHCYGRPVETGRAGGSAAQVIRWFTCSKMKMCSTIKKSQKHYEHDCSSNILKATW